MVGLSSGSLNLLNDVYGAAGEVTAVTIWLPAVQARRFAVMKDELVLGQVLVRSATSTTVWGSGNWLGATTNTTRFLASGSTTDPTISTLALTIAQASVATGTGVASEIRCSILATRYPETKQSISAPEVAEADAVAEEFLVGGMTGSAIYGLGPV